MTFVAHPYERFADDLLTALTGGVIREEHHYRGPDEAYSLATPNVFAPSLRVYGQHGETFSEFEAEIDYRFLPDEQAIAWNLNGQLPDENSYFYINYYPLEMQPRLTDRNPGSVTTTLAEGFAREYAVLHKQMELIYRSAFVDLASGPSLDYIAALLDITRKDAKFASGEVLFKRSTPTPGDISIPPGTLVSTADGINFETTDKRTLRRGQLSVALPIRAQIEGAKGQVDAGVIQILNRPIFGIETVMNEKGSFFASEKETDEELRRRIKGTLERAGKATVDAIRYALIEEIPEITEMNVQVVERADVAGYVDVKLGLDTTLKPEVVTRIEETIFNARPAGVRVVHNLPSHTAAEAGTTGIRREDALQDFQDKHLPVKSSPLDAAALERMPEGIIHLQAEVLLKPVEPTLTAAQKEAIEDEVRELVVNYIEAVPMGMPIVYNKLLGLIVRHGQVADATLLIGAAPGEDGIFVPFGAALVTKNAADAGGNIIPYHATRLSGAASDADGPLIPYGANLDTQGRKPRIDYDHTFVGLMEERVLITLRVLLMLKPGQDPTQVSAEVTPALLQQIKDAVSRVLAQARGELTRAGLMEVILGAVNQSAPHLQYAEKNPLLLDARYEESGRLLSNTERLRLEVYETAFLEPDKGLDVKIAGPLDV